MRNLTATICLTIAVLLGSAGVSWSADPETDPEELAIEFIKSRNWIVGVNNVGQENEFVVGIGVGDNNVAAFCAALTNAVEYVFNPRTLQRKSNTRPPTPSARMKSYMDQPSGDQIRSQTGVSGTLNSKFRIQIITSQKGGSIRVEDSMMQEISIKSRKTNLNCFQFFPFSGGMEFNYKFKSETMDFNDFVKELSKGALLYTFTGKWDKKQLVPTISIIFASKTSMWQ